MKELICIVCPSGCRLKVEEGEEIKVSGAGCKRGIVYGKEEVSAPVRVVTSTVKILGGVHKRLPVRTDRPINKSLVMQAVHSLSDIEMISPVRVGDVVIKNVLDTDVNFIATRDM